MWDHMDTHRSVTIYLEQWSPISNRWQREGGDRGWFHMCMPLSEMQHHTGSPTTSAAGSEWAAAQHGPVVGDPWFRKYLISVCPNKTLRIVCILFQWWCFWKCKDKTNLFSFWTRTVFFYGFIGPIPIFRGMACWCSTT